MTVDTSHTLEVTDGVATLMIDRPDKRNALDVALIEVLIDEITELQRDATVRVLVVTGGGEKSFVAGADINDMVSYTSAQAAHHINVGHRLFSMIEDLAFPTIAAVNGYCLGGGLELAMACDLRVSSANARFGQPEIGIAMPCGWGGTERLQRLLGQSRAKWMMLTGEMITAEQALGCGLVGQVFADVTALRTGAQQLARRIAGFSPVITRTTKFMIRDAHGCTARQIAHRDEALFAQLFTTHDSVEGLRAFLDKRPANYEGR